MTNTKNVHPLQMCEAQIIPVVQGFVLPFRVLVTYEIMLRHPKFQFTARRYLALGYLFAYNSSTGKN